MAAKVKAGEIAFIHPDFKKRSFAEAKLSEIILLCWKYDPNKRPDIFQLVMMLEVAVSENKEHMKRNKRR